MAKKKNEEIKTKDKSKETKKSSKTRKKENTEPKAQVEEKETKQENKKKEPEVRYSDKDLKMFKENILDARNEAYEELQMLKDRLEDLTSGESADESMVYSMHMAEQGSEAQEKEKTYAQIQRTHEYIKKLDEALQKIEDKTYGICRVCGCLIAKERLLAVPITTLSASYKIHKRCPEDGVDKIERIKR